jgi:hypothetical protein
VARSADVIAIPGLTEREADEFVGNGIAENIERRGNPTNSCAVM